MFLLDCILFEASWLQAYVKREPHNKISMKMSVPLASMWEVNVFQENWCHPRLITIWPQSVFPDISPHPPHTCYAQPHNVILPNPLCLFLPPFLCTCCFHNPEYPLHPLPPSACSFTVHLQLVIYTRRLGGLSPGPWRLITPFYRWEVTKLGIQSLLLHTTRLFHSCGPTVGSHVFMDLLPLTYEEPLAPLHLWGR